MTSVQAFVRTHEIIAGSRTRLYAPVCCITATDCIGIRLSNTTREVSASAARPPALRITANSVRAASINWWVKARKRLTTPGEAHEFLGVDARVGARDDDQA